MFSPRVLISSGVGRLHFVDSALALLAHGANVSLLTGWVPRTTQKPLAMALGRMIGRRDLYARLRVRSEMGIPAHRIKQLAVSEAIAQGLFLLGQRGLVPHSPAQAFAWRFFGASGRRHLREHDILHVRSGAGQGGMIREAKRRGMRVIVDHSIAHPSHTEEMLGRFASNDPSRKTLAAGSSFWRIVLRDCAEADVVLVNSDFVRETFIERGFPGERLTVAYLGVREDFIGVKRSWKTEGRVKLLFTGSFCARKGAPQLLEAVGRLIRDGFDCELRIAGTIESESRTLAELHEQGRLQMLGRVPQDRLKELLADADLFVFPTLAEGCAKSAMEAMASGLPVITTRSCGLPRGDGYGVGIVREGSVDELCTSIAALGRDEAARRDSGMAGTRMAAARHTWGDYAKRVIGIYDEVMQ